MGNRRVALAMLAALLLLASCTSTYMGRWVSWRSSDIDDWRRFPSRSIANAPPTFTFAKSAPGMDLTIRDPRANAERDVSLVQLAEQTITTALLVIRNDTLLFEGYYDGHGRDSVNTSFSVAKSITSLLVGVALGEGLIASIDDSITAYLPELEAQDSRFSRITIRHLLDMTSGIRFRDHDLPWGDKPRAYYHPNLRKVLLRELEIADEPGKRWAYNSYNPQLLGLILERVSGGSVARYMESRLWMKLGMEFPASWSLDGDAAPLEKMESGVNTRALDFAKLARLVLRRGIWGGDEVVPSTWIDASWSIRPGCELPDFRPRAVCYQHGWWQYPEGPGQRRAIAATGHLGQFVFVIPSADLIFVRFGRENGNVSWPAVFQAIAERVSR